MPADSKDVVKFKGEFVLPLAEAQLTETVAACGTNGERFLNNVPVGTKVTDIGRGVLIEREGFADVLIPTHMVKREVLLQDIELPGHKAPAPKKLPKAK